MLVVALLLPKPKEEVVVPVEPALVGVEVEPNPPNPVVAGLAPNKPLPVDPVVFVLLSNNPVEAGAALADVEVPVFPKSDVPVVPVVFVPKPPKAGLAPPAAAPKVLFPKPLVLLFEFPNENDED